MEDGEPGRADHEDAGDEDGAGVFPEGEMDAVEEVGPGPVVFNPDEIDDGVKEDAVLEGIDPEGVADHGELGGQADESPGEIENERGGSN